MRHLFLLFSIAFFLGQSLSAQTPIQREIDAGFGSLMFQSEVIFGSQIDDSRMRIYGSFSPFKQNWIGGAIGGIRTSDGAAPIALTDFFINRDFSNRLRLGYGSSVVGESSDISFVPNYFLESGFQFSWSILPMKSFPYDLLSVGVSRRKIGSSPTQLTVIGGGDAATVGFWGGGMKATIQNKKNAVIYIGGLVDVRFKNAMFVSTFASGGYREPSAGLKIGWSNRKSEIKRFNLVYSLQGKYAWGDIQSENVNEIFGISESEYTLKGWEAAAVFKIGKSFQKEFHSWESMLQLGVQSYDGNKVELKIGIGFKYLFRKE